MVRFGWFLAALLVAASAPASAAAADDTGWVINSFGADISVRQDSTLEIVETISVAVVPGSSFYNNAQDGASQVRFTFCKKEETLSATAERLSRLRPS